MLLSKAVAARTVAARRVVAQQPSIPAQVRRLLLLRHASTHATSAGAAAFSSFVDDGGVPWLDSFEVRRSSLTETALDGSDVLGGLVDARSNNGGSNPDAATTAALQSALADHLRARPVDAIVVLAGGLLPDGGLPPWVTRRLDTAAGVRRLQMRDGGGGDDDHDNPNHVHHPALAALVPPRPPIVLSGGGTPHKRPPVDPVTGHPLLESTACARYLMRGGGESNREKGWAVPAASLLKETSSNDTLGNAYFTLVSQAVPRGWKRLAVVTSAFHLPRAKALFVDIAGAVGASLYGDASAYELVFVGARDAAGLFVIPTRSGSDGPGGVDFGSRDDDDDSNNSGGGSGSGGDATALPQLSDGAANIAQRLPSGAQVLAARWEKEVGSVRSWKRARREHGGLETLPELTTWLHATHKCYSVSYQDDFGKRTIQDEALLASY
jgi:hypothetical protein